ncbi:unnamed protein product [Mesocestoides corti]|uniref:LicD family protein n=1 Tax=Mesocestoides corti TaxID=53468 RepID=A0A0R3UMX1_MESCO|nr:unnamed protein product [Mesocestoides corti]
MTATRRKHWKLQCLAVLLFIACALLLKRIHSSPSSRGGVHLEVSIARSQEDDAELRARIIRLAEEAKSLDDAASVDIVHAGTNATYVLRTLARGEFIEAPDRWCSGKAGKPKKHVIPYLRTCFPEVLKLNKTRIRETLRLVRDKFRSAGIPTVITYGSLMGSLRYHRRMPFDCDYDLLVHQADRDRAMQAVLQLAQNPDNRMRIYDLQSMTGCVQIGLDCKPDTDWLKPETWREFGSGVEFHKGIPVGRTWKAYPALMGECAINLDIFVSTHDDVVMERLEEYTPLYRPLEGTLVRVFEGGREYLENYYGSSLDVCIPKSPQSIRGVVHSLPKPCRRLQVPCDDLDVLYPRIVRFSSPDNATIYEVGLEVDSGGRCWINSVFRSTS